MAVSIHHPDRLPGGAAYDAWASIGDARADLDPSRRLGGVPAALERAFDQAAPEWLELARELGAAPGGDLAHTPSCAANVADFGVMLAWTRLIDDWAVESRATLVICDDPWLFRHLAGREGVVAGRAPALWPMAIRMACRGFLARCAVAGRMAWAALRLGRHRRRCPAGRSWLLVYGHPRSDCDGMDGYFGALMRELPELRRVLHVDCPPSRAKALSRDGRSVSLHAWGRPFAALGLPFARWRPTAAHRRGPHGWLVRRAAAREGGTGQSAMIRWQQICQRAWLGDARPGVVAWPWENHAWERDLVRAAHGCGAATLGYQHSVIGSRMLNYSPESNTDRLASIPDRILCTGPATREQLRAWRLPDERLAIGGALRYQAVATPRHDPAAPVFVALPFDGRVAREMIGAIESIAQTGYRFVVKDHPMTPFAFPESDGVTRTDLPLERHDKVSTVVYAATTVGLEAILGGLPTLRFRPMSSIALDILPSGVDVATADAGSLRAALDRSAKPPRIERDFVFAPVDLALWRDHLATA